MNDIILACWFFAGVGYMAPPQVYNYGEHEVVRDFEPVGRYGAKCSIKYNFEVSLEHQSLLYNGFVSDYVDNTATLAIDYKIYFYRR